MKPEATATLGLFDSPIGTTTNTIVGAVGVTSATIAAILIGITWIDGAPKLPAWVFVPFFLLMFPLFLWAVGVQNVLIGRERQRKGLPRRPSFRQGIGKSSFSDLPDGFLRARDWVAMGSGFVVAFVCFKSTNLEGSAPPSRPFLGIAFAFTTFATVVALAEHRRRKSIHLQGVLGWPQPPVPAPRLGRSRGLIAWLLVSGLAIAAIGGTVSVRRLNDYQYGESRLASDGTSTVSLPGGDNVIFVGNLPVSARPPFGPAQVVVIEVRNGLRVSTRWDPSTDHNSPDGVPSLGVISFTTPKSGRYRITISGPSGEKLFVARSPGAEARLVAGWIALLVVGIGILLLGTICVIVRVSWRYRVVRSQVRAPPQTIDEWAAQSGSP